MTVLRAAAAAFFLPFPFVAAPAPGEARRARCNDVSRDRRDIRLRVY